MNPDENNNEEVDPSPEEMAQWALNFYCEYHVPYLIVPEKLVIVHPGGKVYFAGELPQNLLVLPGGEVFIDPIGDIQTLDIIYPQ